MLYLCTLSSACLCQFMVMVLSHEEKFAMQVFFFKGYLVCGPDPRALLLTAISIVFATWVFCEYVANGLSNHSPNLIVIFSIVLTTIVSTSF